MTVVPWRELPEHIGFDGPPLLWVNYQHESPEVEALAEAGAEAVAA